MEKTVIILHKGIVGRDMQISTLTVLHPLSLSTQQGSPKYDALNIALKASHLHIHAYGIYRP